MEEKSLIEYPSVFPIKVMGKDAPEFLPAMVHIAKQFDPVFDEKTVEHVLVLATSVLLSTESFQR